MPRSAVNRRALHFGGFLRNRRVKELTLSLREVARAGGCAFGTLSELERGLYDPMRLEIGMLQPLSVAYRVKIEALLRRLGLITAAWEGGSETD